MLVAVDKFTKWIEAILVTTHDSTAAINFFKSIVFCFGVPIASSQTMGQISHPKNSTITAKVWASSSALLQLRIHR
jgi:hypothetical protein